MKTFKKAVIVAAVVAVSGGSALAGEFCNVKFQNSLINEFPNSVVNVKVAGEPFKLQSHVSSHVIKVVPGSTFKVAYSVGGGHVVQAGPGFVSWGTPPVSKTRFTHVTVGPDCKVSMPLQRVLFAPTDDNDGGVRVIVGPGTQVKNSVTFMPL